MNIEDRLKEKEILGYNPYTKSTDFKTGTIKIIDALSICKEACKKQRKICAEHYGKTRLQGKWLDMIKEEILNAPEPEL